MNRRLIAIFAILLLGHMMTFPASGEALTTSRSGTLAEQINALAALDESGELDRLIAECQVRCAKASVSAQERLELGFMLAAKALFADGTDEAKASWLRAIKQLEKATEDTPTLAEAHSLLGHLYMCPFVEDKTALNKARRHFKKALDIDPAEAAAKEGMRRLALRSTSLGAKEQQIKRTLGDLSRATQSGRKFSIMAVKIADSLESCDLNVTLDVEDLGKTAVTDAMGQMRRIGGDATARVSGRTPNQTVHSLIRMIGEVSGVAYSAIGSLDLELDRIRVTTRTDGGKPAGTMLIPLPTFMKMAQGKVSEREFFGSIVYESAKEASW